MSPIYPLETPTTQHPRALVLTGLLYGNDAERERALLLLEPLLGAPACGGPVRPFDYTDYYQPEMGAALRREYVAFHRLFAPEHLVHLKYETAKVEKALAKDGRRRVNIDPGYVDINKVVLASWKEGLYKIFLGAGVWADPVAHFYEKAFHAEEWTFPDIASGEHFDFFKRARDLYKSLLKKFRDGMSIEHYSPNC